MLGWLRGSFRNVFSCSFLGHVKRRLQVIHCGNNTSGGLIDRCTDVHSRTCTNCRTQITYPQVRAIYASINMEILSKIASHGLEAQILRGNRYYEYFRQKLHLWLSLRIQNGRIIIVARCVRTTGMWKVADINDPMQLWFFLHCDTKVAYSQQFICYGTMFVESIERLFTRNVKRERKTHNSMSQMLRH